ncbi:uncharacterized protein [Branchiostoma lanceolatum]|uniref:uncharacterized protein n=1 Tax=Branchiostoma lanceolatum TaxID=7740 RepID=UPI00345341DC
MKTYAAKMSRRSLDNIMFRLICICLTLFSCCRETAQQEIELEEHERYQDIFPLTQSNFTTEVLDSEEAWIVIFHTGTFTMEWKKMAVALRGVVWVGMIDRREEKDLLRTLGYDMVKTPVARVYHSGHTGSDKRWTDVDSPLDARLHACNSVPDTLATVDDAGLQDFIYQSYASTPTRFPTVIITDEQPSCMLRAMANRYYAFFSFRTMINPSDKDLAIFGQPFKDFELPTIAVLVSKTKDKTDSMTFEAVLYNEDMMGNVNYVNLVKFLFAVNKQYRHTLPGESMAGKRGIVEMRDLLEVEKKRFQVNFLPPVQKAKKEGGLKFTTKVVKDEF